MINKFKKFKKGIRQSLLQTWANILIKKAESELESTDSFLMVFEQAARLNAYCIVFHDIYLD